MERLEHRDGVALDREEIGVDQAGRAGADHRDRRLFGALPRRNIIRRDEGGVAAFFAGEAIALRQVPFELADLDRPARDGADALALQFLRADAAGDVRQRVARLDQRKGLFELALAHQVQHIGDVDGDRAAASLALVLAEDALLARPVLALLVAQHFEPHEHVDFAQRIAELAVAEIARRHQLEVVLAHFSRPHIRVDVVAARPILGQTLEHRVAVRQVGVDRGDELALELERHRPDEAQQDRRHVVVAQQQAPQHLGEARAERILGELPDDRLQAVVDEHLTKRLRAVQQPLAQQAELLLEDLERLGVFEFLDLGLRRFERMADLAVALEIETYVGPRSSGRGGGEFSAHG